MITQSVTLAFKEGGSDKVYRVFLEEINGLYSVNVSYGRRGGTMIDGTKTNAPTSLTAAANVYGKIVKEKMAKGYQVAAQSQATGPATTVHQGFRAAQLIPVIPPINSRQFCPPSGPFSPVCVLLNAIPESQATDLLSDNDWVAQQKFDGTRLVLRSTTAGFKGFNRKGALTTVPDSVAQAIKGIDCTLDGELIGNVYYTFDCLRLGLDFCATATPLIARLTAMRSLSFNTDSIVVVNCAVCTADKVRLWDKLKADNAEGIVFKGRNAPYTYGRPSSGGLYLKHKFYKTCSCVVTKINQQRSVGVSLDRGTELEPVGNVTIPPNFNVPSLNDIVEVRYLYAFLGGSLYQPTYLGCRTDIALEDCTMGQLVYKNEDDANDN